MKAGRTVFTNGSVLTMVPGRAPIVNGTVVVKGERITAVREAGQEPPAAAGADTRIIDCTGRIVLPGLINGHVHLPMCLFRGLADDLALREWLEEHIFPVEARFITPDSAAVGSRLGMAEMLLSGTTTCADGYFCEGAVLAAAKALGLRGIFAHGCIDFPAPGVPDPSRKLAVVREFLECFGGGRQQAPGVFAHSPYTCSAATLQGAKELAREFGVRFFTHVAEAAWEVGWCREHCDGMTPVTYLDSLGILDPDTTLVHAVHVTEAEADRIAASGASVVINTESNMKLGAGIAPLELYLERQIPVGLGTDSCASNNDLDLLSEVRTTARLHRARTEAPNQPDDWALLELVTCGSARALGLHSTIGSLEPGKAADIVTVRLELPCGTPRFDPCTHLVHDARASAVDTVMVAGEVLVQGGRLVRLDVDDVLARARQWGARIRRFAESRRAG